MSTKATETKADTSSNLTKEEEAKKCPECNYHGEAYLVKNKTVQFPAGYVVEYSSLESETTNKDGSKTQIYHDHRHCPKCGFWKHDIKRTVKVEASK